MAPRGAVGGAAGEAWARRLARQRPWGCVAAPSVTTAGATLVGCATRGSCSCGRRVFLVALFDAILHPLWRRHPHPRLSPHPREASPGHSLGRAGSSRAWRRSPAVSFCLTAASTAWIACPRPPHCPPAFRTWGLFARSVFLFEALNPLPPPPLRSAPREHPPDLPVWRPGEAPTLCLVDFGVRSGSDRGAATRSGAALRGHFWT